jgi:hypothetical protein
MRKPFRRATPAVTALIAATALAGGAALPTAAFADAAERAERVTQREAQRAARAEERAARREQREHERLERREQRERERAERKARHHHHGDEGTGETGQESGTPSAPAGPPAKAGTQAACRVTIASSLPRIAAGEAVVLSGQVSCPEGVDAGGLEVTVSERHGGSGQALEAAGTATTLPDGSYSLAPLSPASNTYFRASLAGSHHHAHAAVKVAPVITLSAQGATATQALNAAQGASAPQHGAANRALRAPRETFTGTVSPAKAGSLVALQAAYPDSPQSWRTVGFGRVAPDGSYSIGHSFRLSGPVTLRAVAHSGRAYIAAVSAPLSYEAPAVQSPARPPAPTRTVTLAPTPSSVALGQPLAITGTVTPAPAGQQVYLESQSPFGVSFHVIAVASADESGAFAFSYSFAKARDYVLRVRVPDDGHFAPATSAPFTVHAA